MIDAKKAAGNTVNALENLIDEIGRDIDTASSQGYFKLTYNRFGTEERYADAVITHAEVFTEAGYSVDSYEQTVSLDWGVQ